MTQVAVDTASIEELNRQVAVLVAQGYGDSPGHPHPPTVVQTDDGPVVGWRAHCTGAGCGTYVEDIVGAEPPVDYLCDDCEDERP